MAKQQGLVMKWEVKEVLGWWTYKVYLPEIDMEVTAYPAGKMKKFNIRILEGDEVDVELNQYDPTKGRIVYRHKYVSKAA